MLDTTSDSRPRAIVVGSGFGGLAAAVRLGAKGYRVSVLEKLDKPGGRAYTYKQDGYTFDAGPTIITAPQVFHELWELCGKRFDDYIDLRPSNPFYDIRFDDGRVFRYSGDDDEMRAEVARFNPDDLDGFERFKKVSEDIYKVAFEKLVDVPFHSLSSR
jgi:phytoene desaturase